MPNALKIFTKSKTYFFASFIDRDHVLEVIRQVVAPLAGKASTALKVCEEVKAESNIQQPPLEPSNPSVLEDDISPQTEDAALEPNERKAADTETATELKERSEVTDQSLPEDPVPATPVSSNTS